MCGRPTEGPHSLDRPPSHSDVTQHMETAAHSREWTADSKTQTLRRLTAARCNFAPRGYTQECTFRHESPHLPEVDRFFKKCFMTPRVYYYLWVSV